MKKYTIKRDVSERKPLLDYEKELNREQLEAVFAPDGPILVIAGAGSGKTRVVTYRVARLLERGVSPNSILLLTFTNKAAREMLHRVEHLLKIDTRYIWGGTFHHIGNLILRHHSKLVDFKGNFTILDNEDAKDLIEVVTKEAKLDSKERRFPKGQVLREVFSYAVNTMDTVEETVRERFPYLLDIVDEIEFLQKRYVDKKRSVNAMDFDDLLALWHRVLAENEELRRHYASVFSHILVDEYQDTNRIQAEIVDFMGRINRNVVVVGDDAQSIYSFRGADFQNILEFPTRYPEARVFRLETNYRSTPEVLRLANCSIARNTKQFEKNLRAVRGSGLVPVLAPLRDVLQQAEFVAQRILELRDEGVPLREIAVLYRAHYHSMELQMELTRRDIPFEVRSGLRFFEQAHIKDVCAFLRVMVNPTDEISWKRIFKMFPKIGKKTADHLYDYLKMAENPVDLLITRKIGDQFKALQKETLDIWSRLFAQLKDLAELEAPSEMISSVLKNGYRDYLKLTYANYDARMEDLGQLTNFSTRYQSLVTFLSDLSLMSGVSGEEIVAAAGREDEKVILSTIHQAKGLEWKAVFIIWCAEGRFPNPKAVEEGATEEERRLFYVASTRAMDELYLCYPLLTFERQIGHVILKPSRFISELESTTYDEWQVSDL
jgi:DNA helicase-2/ATP-dependent DNA helicase PcrA